MDELRELTNYTKDEVKNLLQDESKLSVMEVDGDKYIVSKDDIIDIIGDFGWNRGMSDLSFKDYETDRPICNTFGMFLNKCDPEFRKENLERLIQLQTGEVEPKPYKVVSLYDFYDVKEKIDEQNMMNRYFNQVMKQECRSDDTKVKTSKSPKIKM